MLKFEILGFQAGLLNLGLVLIIVTSGGSRISRRGVDLLRGHRLRGGYVSKILYVETKETGPLRGVRQTRLLDPSILLFGTKMQHMINARPVLAK